MRKLTTVIILILFLVSAAFAGNELVIKTPPPVYCLISVTIPAGNNPIDFCITPDEVASMTKGELKDLATFIALASPTSFVDDDGEIMWKLIKMFLPKYYTKGG